MFIFFLLLVYSHAANALEMNNILKELSWTSKLKILNEISPAQNKTPHEKPSKPFKPMIPLPPSTVAEPTNSTPGQKPSIPESEARPSNDTGFNPKVNATTASNTNSTPQISYEVSGIAVKESFEPIERRVGVQLLREAERRANEEDDDKDMRLKLFRLMYETVRDSDLKVKRAELIKEHYVNSTSFEIGYILGDISDKANIITDISVTLKRFYKEWKPMEHINVYEQISNQAIEITRLIDLVRVLSRKEATNGRK